MKTGFKKIIPLVFSSLLFTLCSIAQISISPTVVTISSGNGTWTVPTGVTSIQVEVWGGGGAGGGTASNNALGGGGGAAGAYALKALTVSPNSSISYSVGTGGAGALSETATAASGSPTWFSSTATLNAPGGAGGSTPNSGIAQGGTGVAGTNGTINIAGESGFASSPNSSGAGGSSPSGGAGGISVSSSTGGAGNAGSVPGGGGSGAFVNNNNDRTGGSGGNGRIRITYTTNYSFSYYYGAQDAVRNTSIFIGASGQVPLSASYYTSSGVKKVSVLAKTAGSFSMSSPTTFSITLADNTVLTSGTDYTFNQLTGIIVVNQSALIKNNNFLDAVFSFVSGGITYSQTLRFAAAALPVSLSNFSTKVTPSNVISLAWTTSSEIVNKGFSIERQTNSANGKYESIGFVASKAPGGNSQTPLYYSFTDEMPSASATNFYRLAQQDLDGKISYSEVRSVKLGKETVTMLFPNPSNGVVNISRTNNGKKMNIIVVDLSGRIISQINGITDSNYSLKNLRPGVYNIKMTYPETGEQSVQKVVVQK